MFYFCFCVVVVVVVVYYNLKYWVSKAGVLLMAGYQQSSATCKTPFCHLFSLSVHVSYYTIDSRL